MTWLTKKLGEVCEIYQPQTITSKEILKEGPYKVFSANGIIGYYSRYNHDDPEVIVGCGGTCGSVYFTEPRSWITGNAMVVRPKIDNLSKTFLYYYLQIANLTKTITGTSQPQITRGTLSPLKIPLPPIKIQQKIVERLDVIKKAQELIDKQIALGDELFQSLLNRELKLRKDWEIRRLGEIIEPQYNYTVAAKDKGNFRFIRITDIGDDGELKMDEKNISAREEKLSNLTF